MSVCVRTHEKLSKTLIESGASQSLPEITLTQKKAERVNDSAEIIKTTHMQMCLCVCVCERRYHICCVLIQEYQQQ